MEGINFLRDKEAAEAKVQKEGGETKDYFGYDSKDFAPEKGSSSSSSGSYDDSKNRLRANMMNELQSARASGNSTLIAFWEGQLGQMSGQGGYSQEKPLVSGYYDRTPGGWELSEPPRQMTEEERAFADLQNLRSQIVR